MTAEAKVTVVPLTADRWADVQRLFGPSGAFSNCWCTWWRQLSNEFAQGIKQRGAGNRALLHALTEAGTEPGLLAYRDGESVGWMSVGPRASYERLLRSRSLGPPAEEADDPDVWSIVCFWMPRSQRGQGLATTLLAAAIDHARSRGGRTLEAYPIDTASGRRPPAGLFTGTLGMFARAGFHEVERRRDDHPIMRLSL